MTNPYSKFLITDGTTDTDSGIRHEVDLVGLVNGICIQEWSMRVAETKNGGVWADSSLADGRFLKVSKLANVQETLTLTITDWTADALADDLHLLYDLLEKARNWGPSGWSNEPVWIEAVGVNETNTRYALVHDYRTPGAGNPFDQPFWQRVLRSTINEFELVLEHEPAWRGNYPGDSDCVEISAMQSAISGYPLDFNGDTSEVDLASPAILDDLAVGASFTVEAWINADGWGENNEGFICDKSGNSTVGWTFHHTNAGGLRGVVYFDVTDAISTSGLDEWTTTEFDEWHHVAMVFSNATKQIRLFIDGTEVSSYVTQQAGANNALADAAQTVQIGNVAAGTRGWDGEIGWLRIAASALYAANFTPDPRCPLPGFEAFTAWLGIHEGTGSTIYDMSGNGNNGSTSNTAWGAACTTTYGTYDPVNDEREESCNDEFAFVANKHNTIGLTHIFIDDNGAYSANLLHGDPPYSLLPAVPAANDRVYFGIQSTLDDAGPFCSLVFDLSQAQANIADIVWEYWNGAWVALTVQDNTDADGAMTGAAFDTTGRKSVHWVQPSDWATTTINGVTALWVRAEVQDAGTQPPIQQNRHVYTILWPYVEVQKDQLEGNIPALARLSLQNQSDNHNTVNLWQNRMIMGLRSVDRGTDFTAITNISDLTSQNFNSAPVSATGVGAWANDLAAPTGRALTVTNPAAIANVSHVQILDATSYQGTFRMFLRAKQTSGSAGDLSFRLWATSGLTVGNINAAFWVSDIIAFDFTNDWQMLDFGIVTVDTEFGSLNSYIYFGIDAEGDGAADATVYELITMPVDEYSVEALDPYNTSRSHSGERDNSAFVESILVDSVEDTRRWRTVVTSPADYIKILWQGRAPEGPILLPNTRQRLWFVSTRYPSTATTEQRSEPYVCGSAQLWATERYLLMRGDK